MNKCCRKAGAAVLSAGAAVFALWAGALWCRRGKMKPELFRVYRYAHRGLHEKPLVPENSLTAFHRAVEHGYGAELDVHLTADGRLAVIHDSDVKRVTGQEGIIESLTEAEMKTLSLEGTDERIPLLEEVLPIFEGKAPLIIELKTAGGNASALCEAVCALLDDYKVTYCIESFDPRCLIWLRKHRPEIVRGQLSEHFDPAVPEIPNKLIGFILSNLLENFLTRPDFIAYNWKHRNNLSLKLAKRLYGVQEVSWTVKDPLTAQKAEAEKNIVIFEKIGA